MSIYKIIACSLVGGLVTTGLSSISITVISLLTWEFTNMIDKSQKEYYRTHNE